MVEIICEIMMSFWKLSVLLAEDFYCYKKSYGVREKES